MRLKTSAAIAAGALSLALAACGGGGGGTSGGTTITPPPPPPPPPPPANVPPEVNYTLSSGEPDEGRPFWIDASGSTDADDDTLTITVTQVSGPAPSDVPLYEGVPTGEGIFAFRAPEVDEDAVMTFEISVSDGEDTSTETVTITIVNIVLTPELGSFGETLATFDGLHNPIQAGFYSEFPAKWGLDDQYRDYENGVIGLSDAEDDSGRVIFRVPFDYVGQVFHELEQVPLPESSGGEPAFIRPVHVATLSEGPHMMMPVAGIDRLNKIFVVPKTSDYILNIRQSHDIDAPCTVADLPVDGTIKRHLVVGTRGNGLQVFRQLPDDPGMASSKYEAGEVLTDTGTYCTISTGATYVAGFEAETGTINYWTYGVYPNLETGSVTIDLPDDAPPLVDAELVYSGAGNFMLGLVMSDGEHDGHHELHIYYNDFYGNSTIMHDSFSWTKGVPAEISYVEHTGSWTAVNPGGFFVPLETAPYAIFADQEGVSTYGDQYPIFETIGYVPTGLWVTSVRASYATDLSSSAVTLTKTKAGEVILKLFEHD